MASELKSNNARSPRFSTTKALGFRGGSIGPGGNLQHPTFQETEGARTTRPAAEEEAGAAPAINQFSAAVPKGPSLGSTLAAGAVSAAGGEIAKQGIKRGVQEISGLFGAGYGAAPGTLDTANAVGASGGDSLGSLIEQNAGRWGVDTWYGAAPGTVDAANAVGDSGGDALGSLISGNAENWGVDVADIAGAEGADSLIGSAGADTVGGGVPVVGPVLRLAQGDVGGAAGSAIGGTIGSTFGPIGTAIGSFIGGNLGGDCFITEAVMSAGGQGDTAPELQALRQFRDGVLATTPQGQALIQEYEQIAPMVVEAVMMRPDSMQIFQSIDAQFINPAVEAIQQGNYQKALQIYAQMIAFVTPYAAEGAEGGMMMPGQEGQAATMQKMGEHAAMVSHSPEMAGMATGDMGDMGMMDEDPTGYDGGPGMMGMGMGGDAGGGMGAGMGASGGGMGMNMGATPAAAGQRPAIMDQFAQPPIPQANPGGGFLLDPKFQAATLNLLQRRPPRY